MDTGQVNRNINQYLKDSIIFEERTKATQIGMVIKGRIVVESSGMRDVLYSGSFLGVQDIYAGSYLCTYKALDDAIICLFDVSKAEELYQVILSNPDYCGLVIASLSKQIGNLYTNYELLYNGNLEAYQMIKQYEKSFQALAYEIKLEKDMIPKAYGLNQPERPTISGMIKYYTEMSSFNLDSVRSFFSQGNYVVKHHMAQISGLLRDLMEINSGLVNNMLMLLDVLIGSTEESVFYKFANLALLAEERGKNAGAVLETIDQIIDSINRSQNIVESASSKKVNISRERMEQIYCQILSGNCEELNEVVQETGLSDEEILRSTQGALDIILNYGQIDFELASVFKADILRFLDLKDRLTMDDNIRALRHKLADNFYEIYEKVFYRAYTDSSKPLVIQFFLNYGFIDERLLEEEQILELYKVSRIKEGGKYNVYTIYEWLCLVYEGKKEPSKNEFDLNYAGWLREELVAKRISQADYNERIDDKQERLHFEVHNFFRYINRIANGRITTFVPILHKDMFFAGMERLFVGAHKIEAAMQRILDIDYSLFYREVGYVNQLKKIEKEYIMKEVFPEFILVPTVGTNGVMWQTIADKQKDTPARFIMPVFAEGNVNDMLFKICAKFRWEMCRTIQGSTWNNIKYKSLTSEYLDYIQFYRKNHDLSEEKKEKIKLQIQKCSNRMADVFTIDYEAWVRGESQGAVRLNKVARRILAMYCPFEKNLRNRMMAQPLFAEPIQAFELERQKKARELGNRYKSLQNNQVEITKELYDNLEFYQEL